MRKRWIPSSLRMQLLLTSSLVVVLFFLFAIAILDAAFKRNAENATQDQLSAQLYALLSVSDLNDQLVLEVAESPAEPRFNVPESGLYAYIFDQHGTLIWKSESALYKDEPKFSETAIGRISFSRWHRVGKRSGFKLAFTVAWELEPDTLTPYQFIIYETPTRYLKSVREFRSVLLWWSSIASVFLLLILVLILNWALSPLQKVTREIRRIENGLQEHVEGVYPDEISTLTRNINILIGNSQKTLVRYRNSLGDLAHSLKTPLALMRGIDVNDSSRQSISQLVEEQSRRMHDIVEYQLKRASTAGSSSNFSAVNCAQLVDRILVTLSKVYASKSIRFQNQLQEHVVANMDESDFLEVFGNIIENAAKWCDSVVKITLKVDSDWLCIDTHDDGPGIPEKMYKEVFSRGVRNDQRKSGQGIGLAVVAEIVESYAGSVDATKSDLGGARIRIKLPVRNRL